MNVLKIAALVCAATAVGFACDAASGSSLFHFRTTPWFVTPGRPFTVDVETNICYALFVGNHGGFEYGGVSIKGNIVEIRYGYFQDLTCDSLTYPVSQNVPGLPAGNYEVRAIFQPLDDGTSEFLETTFELQVTSRIPGAPHPIPAIGWAGIGLCSLLVAGATVGRDLRRPRM